MDWFAAPYTWLVAAVSGPAAAFVAGYVVDTRKAAIFGIVVAALVAVWGVVEASKDGDWGIAVGALLGAATAWWQLYRQNLRQPQ